MIPAVPTTPAILGAAAAVCWVVCRCLAIVIAYKEINGRKPQQKRSMLPWQLSVTDCFVWALRLELVYTFHLLVSVPLQLLSIRLFWWMQRQLTDADVVFFVLNTGLAMHLQEDTTNQFKGTNIWQFHIDQIALTFPKDKYDGSVDVTIDIENRRVVCFLWNGVSVSSPKRMMLLLQVLNGAVVHPQIHSFQNQLYESCKTIPTKYWRMNAFAQYLNESSYTLPSRPVIGFGCGPDWCKRLVCHNAAKVIPKHSHHLRNQKLLKASPYLRFCIQARHILFKELDRAGLQVVDKEAYFICSVLHSLDHAQHGESAKWVYFDCPLEGDQALHNHNWFLRTFSPSLGHYPINNLLKTHYRSTQFYTRLYERLYAIDPRLADRVALSISE